MQEFKQQLMSREYSYIYEEYFNNLKVSDSFVKMKTRPASKCDALINDIPYTLYRYECGSILLVPKTNSLFKGDFSNIYWLGIIKNIGMDFSIIKKDNGIIKCFNYDFLINGLSYIEDYVVALVNYSTMDDQENTLYCNYKDKGVTSETYLARKDIYHLDLPRETNIVELRKYKDGRVEKCTYPKLEELHKLLTPDFKFEQMNVDKEAPLINVVEDMVEEKGFARKRKINN